MTTEEPSLSEEHGLAAITDPDLMIYSVGISTTGRAEMRLARANPKRHIVATTIDAPGVEHTTQAVQEAGLADNIEVKLENVSQQPLPYPNEHFDFVYARLVLHYLSAQALDKTLQELHRILKPGGKLYVVVRSVNCPDAKRSTNTYDPVTHLTSGAYDDPRSGRHVTYTRYFHSEESIRGHVENASFHVAYTKMYEEQLHSGFMRELASLNLDNVVELLATK